MFVLVYLCLSLGIIVKEKYCIPFLSFKRERNHLPVCPRATYTLKVPFSGSQAGWQLHLFSAHMMPEAFRVFIRNFDENTQGGRNCLLSLMTKLRFQHVKSKVTHTAGYRG